MDANPSTSVSAELAEAQSHGTAQPPAASPFGAAPDRPVVREVPLSEIDAEDERFRYRNGGDVRDLRVSISHRGLREPVELVADRPFRVIDGFRRIEALRSLGYDTVRAIVREDVSELEAHRISFVKNIVSKNLSPIDRANAIQRARRQGRARGEIAKDFGLSEKQIRRYEALLDLPDGLLRLVEKGELSMAHARVLADSGRPDWRDWVERMREYRWSAELLKSELEEAGEVSPTGTPRVYLKVDDEQLRMYAFSVALDAPEAERAYVAGLLREAAETLEAGLRREEAA